MKIPLKRTRMYSASFGYESRSFKETLIESLFDLALVFSCKARNRGANNSLFKESMTKLCIKNLAESDSAIESAFPSYSR